MIFIATGAADIEASPRRVKAGRKDAAGRPGQAAARLVYEHAGASAISPTDEEESIPSYRFPESVARALGPGGAYGEWRSPPTGSSPSSRHGSEGAKAICERRL